MKHIFSNFYIFFENINRIFSFSCSLRETLPESFPMSISHKPVRLHPGFDVYYFL